jgi:NADH-quinone oxidoreductase subunit L
MDVIAWVGALTSLLAALIAITQRDIKKILAYSTVSQLGYMILACGVGAFSTGMFHVFTHAFFKALLFLCAASVIYGCHHEQDIFKMGGLKKKMPITFWTFFVGLLAISGIPGFSGFFSKDEILVMALTNPGNGPWLYAIALVTALITAFYMTRMMVLVFIVEPAKAEHAHDDHGHHEIHESPSVMTVPLIILALCSALAGYLGIPHLMSHDNSRLFQQFVERFVAKTTGHSHLSVQTEIIMMALTTIFILASMGLAYYIYVKNDHRKLRDTLQEKFKTIWSISFSKFKVDEFYEVAIINPLYKIGHFLVDIVETHIINGVVKLVTKMTTEGGGFLDDNKPERLEMGILYIVIGLTVLITAIFNAFIFR